MTLAQQVQEAIERVQGGAASQYIKAEGVTVRVSNHGANPDRVDGKFISFVIPVEEVEDEEYTGSSMQVAKKSFRSIPGQYVIVDGSDENGYSVEDILDYELN